MFHINGRGPMSFHVVRAGLAHLDVLVPLFDGYRRFYDQPSDPAGARAFLHARLAGEEAVIFVALPASAEAQAGWGFTQLYPYFSSVQMRKLWLLNDLYVVPGARRQGVGQALMAAAHAWGRETGAAQVTLATAQDNHTAQRLYEALGYVKDEAFAYYALTL